MIARAWHYSRTIFINVLSAIAAMLIAIIPVALGMDWSVVFSPKLLLLWLFFLNALNVVLRLMTHGPVGEKE